MVTIDLASIKYVTLYTGNNSPLHCVCKCPCCSQWEREELSNAYQGTEFQVAEILDKLPSLEQLYILGNPDPAVDTIFCNRTATLATGKGIHVCFSSSGVGGTKFIKNLLCGISPKMVDYISLSIDSIDTNLLSILKGRKYPFEDVLKEINWCNNNGYTVKVQPTLWNSNYQGVYSLIDFFASRGISWFSFHIGSLESGIYKPETHRHLFASEIKYVHEQIEKALIKYPNLKIRCPIIYPECGENDTSKWYCMHPERCKELLIFLKNGQIVATHAPLASNFNEHLMFDISKEITVPSLPISNTCPYSNKLLGRNELSLCRYISKTWNYM